MVNELRELLSDSVASPPHDDLDVRSVVAQGRRRVRRRRLAVGLGAALTTAAVVTTGSVVALDERSPDLAAAGVPRPDAPTLRLADAEAAVEGEDFRVLASHTNEDLDADNGQYFDGVTDDGLLLFRDGPRMEQRFPGFTLRDPATGDEQQLPELAVDGQTWPLDLGEDRLVLLSAAGGERVEITAHVLDRGQDEWRTVTWPGLPRADGPFGVAVGPDDRVYVPAAAARSGPPEGGWPTGPDGEVDDADADGETHRLWSASLTDPSDVRDEGLTVGSVDFTDEEMVWTDSRNGDAGRVHVRDLATGEERAFDPRSGERCNLLTFGATDDHVVLGQYCGTYDGGVRDDRVQVLDHDGDQVVTLQGSGVEGRVDSVTGAGVVTVTAYEGAAGTYAYDLASGRFLKVADGVSSWGTSGPTHAGQLLWNTPVNRGDGMTQHLGELLD